MSNIVALKVKIKSLAAEARIIRHEENKKRRHIDKSRLWKRISKIEGLTDAERRHKFAELAAPPPSKKNSDEGATSRFLARKLPALTATELSENAKDAAVFQSLKTHRREPLRQEARIAHLAYALLRGVPYAAVEKNTHDAVSDDMKQRLKEMANRFGGNFTAPSRTLWDVWVTPIKHDEPVAVMA